jgi:hypothetical protein
LKFCTKRSLTFAHVDLTSSLRKIVWIIVKATQEQQTTHQGTKYSDRPIASQSTRPPHLELGKNPKLPGRCHEANWNSLYVRFHVMWWTVVWWSMACNMHSKHYIKAKVAIRPYLWHAIYKYASIYNVPATNKHEHLCY